MSSLFAHRASAADPPDFKERKWVHLELRLTRQPIQLSAKHTGGSYSHDTNVVIGANVSEQDAVSMLKSLASALEYYVAKREPR